MRNYEYERRDIKEALSTMIEIGNFNAAKKYINQLEQLESELKTPISIFFNGARCFYNQERV